MKKRVLIIEDEADLAAVERARLEAAGYDVECVDNGEDGLMRIKHGLPDLVILDLVLPKLDGVEVLKQAKANHDTKTIPIIVMTAYGIKEVYADCLKYGAEAVMQKPYNPFELLKNIDRLINKKK